VGVSSTVYSLLIFIMYGEDNNPQYLTMKMKLSLVTWSLVVGAVLGAPRLRRRTRFYGGTKKRFIVQVKNNQGRQDVQRFAGTPPRDIYDDYISTDLDETELDLLLADNNILSLEEDTQWESLGFRDEPSEDEFLPGENGYHRHLQEQVGYGVTEVQAEQLQVGDSPVTVCIIDSGFDAGHPDLDLDRTSGVDRNSTDGSIMYWSEDPTGHGTHVSGIIAARINNNLGVRGVGSLPLFISRALNDRGRAFQSDIMGALQDCENSGAKVISLSLGGSYITQGMRKYIAELYDKGMLLVSASGNDGKMQATYPGAHRDVVSVSALMPGGVRWNSSNYGPWLEMAAPGYRINSTYPGGGYALFTGTSMAAPFVSGVAALVWSHFPKCQHSQIRYALAKTAVDLGDVGCDAKFGYGIVQARAAYEFLLANPCDAADWGRSRVTGMCTTLTLPTDSPTEV